MTVGDDVVEIRGWKAVETDRCVNWQKGASMSLKSGVEWVVGGLYNQGEKTALPLRREGGGTTGLARRLCAKAHRPGMSGCEPSQFFEPCRSLAALPPCLDVEGGVRREVRSEPRSCRACLGLVTFSWWWEDVCQHFLPESTTPPTAFCHTVTGFL